MDNNQVINSEETEINLKEIFMALWSKIWMILIVGLLVAIGAFLYTKLAITPLYQSQASMVVLNKSSSDTLSQSDVNVSTSLTSDYQILIKDRTVMEKVIENLSLNMTVARLKSSIVVDNPTNTRILNITVKDSDPVLAQKIVNEVVTVSGQHIVEVLSIEAVNVSEWGSLDYTVVSPNTMKNTFIGGLLGVVLSCAVIIVIYLLNDSIKTPEDIEKYLNISVLGIIPIDDELEYDKSHGGKKKHKHNSK